MKRALFILFLPWLGGCPASMSDLRGGSSQSATFQSAKSPDQIAGCISDIWQASPSTQDIQTLKSADGWTLTNKGGAWIFGLVDIKASGNGSAVKFSSNWSQDNANATLPAVKKCI